MPVGDERALSVSQAMTLAKQALEGVRARVIGEISEFSDKSAYKAVYFTVCDSTASMPCIMWRDAFAASGITLRNGMQVEISGQFSAYAAKGRMQFSVRTLEPAGEGRLRMQVAELARRLEAEGLMRPEHKRALPTYPSRIAVVTSPRGKAVHDVLRTLRRRYPVAEVLVAGIAVEGEGAPAAIAAGIAAANEAGCDVLLLVRGGGSYEDLMPFNSEQVARAVSASAAPVITGIGHEPDNSIADMVADVRASTPTAAAEAAAPSVAEMRTGLERDRRMLGRALGSRVQSLAHRVARLAERPAFCDAHALLGPAVQQLDLARMRLHRAIPDRLARDAQRVGYARERLVLSARRVTEPFTQAVGLESARLDNLSPLKILSRGYAAAFMGDGHTVVRSIAQVAAGEVLTVRVSDGHIGCRVEGVEREEG
jgi:exodeoxyribonuclease VII large subunit